MITVLHGDYIEASRKELLRIKASCNAQDIVELDAKTMSDELLTQAADSRSLLHEKRLIILENVFSTLGKNTKRQSSLIERINGIHDADIIIWENKELSSAVLKKFTSSVKISQFKIPVQIFNFLDTIQPGNTSSLIRLYQAAVASEPPEIIFYLIIRRFRHLISLCDNCMPEGILPWQMNRLTRQAKSFTMKKLIQLYRQLLYIEREQRSGMSAFSLSQQIELWLLHI